MGITEQMEKEPTMGESGKTSEAAVQYYQCDECGLKVEKQDVRWSKKEGRALCPRCEWPLDAIR
jgi:uncharacterized paraquat-inducible protein A